MAVLGQQTLQINNSTLGPITGNAPMYACRAWVNFNGNNNTIRGSSNVSSITRPQTGRHVTNFITAMPDTNSGCIATSEGPVATGPGTTAAHCFPTVPGIAVSSATIDHFNPTNSNARINPFICSVAIFR